MKHIGLLSIFLSIMLGARFSLAEERVHSFDSDITIAKNGSMRVVETVRVNVEHRNIRRGIYRTFPATYIYDVFLVKRVPFRVLSVLRDGQPEQFQVVRQGNGYRVDIGPDITLIPRGNHTYIITYQTDRQLGFFGNHDELYWNVNGTGWDFPIDYVRAVVHLPEPVARDQFKIHAYTGGYGHQGTDYTAVIAQDGKQVSFETKKGLLPRENLSIVVAFPKGVVAAPSTFTLLYYFGIENGGLLFAIFALLFLFTYYLRTYLFYYRRQKKGVIVPLFYPPDTLRPGEIGFIDNRGFNNRQFTADLVAGAVSGFLTIEMSNEWFKKKYTIRKKENVPANGIDQFPALSDFLEQHKSITFGTYNKEFASFLQKYQKKLKEKFEKKLLIDRLSTIAFCLLISLVIGGITLFLAYDVPSVTIATLAIMIILAFVFYRLLNLYTPEGRAVEDKIEGFTLFLNATEKDRIERIGTPPTKTPELYEKYLPYAIALGVENRWAQQFESLFAQMAAQGHSYQPVWYLGGGRYRDFSASTFASDLGSSLHSAIASSSQAPGSTSGLSGSSGSGFSGGGGGGGGGGGR